MLKKGTWNISWRERNIVITDPEGTIRLEIAANTENGLSINDLVHKINELEWLIDYISSTNLVASQKELNGYKKELEVQLALINCKQVDPSKIQS